MVEIALARQLQNKVHHWCVMYFEFIIYLRAEPACRFSSWLSRRWLDCCVTMTAFPAIVPPPEPRLSTLFSLLDGVSGLLSPAVSVCKISRPSHYRLKEVMVCTSSFCMFQTQAAPLSAAGCVCSCGWVTRRRGTITIRNNPPPPS